MSITVKHDGAIDISTGKSRRETTWRNRQTTWGDMLNKLSKTHRTAEKHTEYLAFQKDLQDDRKDSNGAYVGGILTNGSRKKGNVLTRQLITLDVDFATKDFWDDFTLLYSNAACIHSTHKHSPDKPRLRLIIPLSRPVFADEYMAIAHKIAGVLDIELFDTTTFQPERLMYWPSTSKDGEFVFNHQDGEWLDADEILASYTDWTDSCSWPVSIKVDTVVRRDIVKAGDPTKKTGVVGAWCRTYTVTEAIESFLTDLYTPTDMKDRFTYKEGSTAGGLVVYDDMFAYSHHGSDPVSGKLSNSFDLVRLHKFGLRDDKTDEKTPITQVPSFQAMVEFAGEDKEVKKIIVQERLEKAKQDFDTDTEVEAVADWAEKLDMTKNGSMLPTINNIVLCLENDPSFKGAINYDEFERRAVFTRDMPWRKIEHSTRYLTDQDDHSIELRMEQFYKLNCNKLEKAMSTIYMRNKVHPVRDYLKSITWDGVARVDNLFVSYMGAEDNKYTRAVTRKTLCGACARVFEPGCRFDTVLTFVGKQGLGKSSLIGKLGKRWFSDNFTTVHGKEAIEQLQGRWLIEVAELSGLKRSDVEAVKSYITRREDRYRPAYGHRIENFPRQCIFFASTNKMDFLTDTSGNRRFWPINCLAGKAVKNVFTNFSESEVDQVWAEAYIMYKKGEDLHLSPELEALAFKVQEAHSKTDVREAHIIKYLDTLLPVTWEGMDVHQKRAWLHQNDSNDESIEVAGTVRRDKVCVAEICSDVYEMRPKDMKPYDTQFVQDVMQKATGWADMTDKEEFKGYGMVKGYYRTSEGIKKIERKQVYERETN